MRRSAIAAAVVAGVLGVGLAVILAGREGSDSGDAVATTAPSSPTVTIHDPRPGPTPVTGHPTADPIPILMYHAIADPPEHTPFPGLYVSGPVFARQIAWLAGHGYHAVTLQDAYDHWRTGEPLPGHPIVISFDDGYHSQFATAAPVLSRHRWPGVLDLEVRNTGRSWGVSSRQVRVLIVAGWEIAAHTLTHPDLTTVGRARLEHEIGGSRAVLRARFGVPVNFFCYPSGRLNDAVAAAVRAAGYLGATTTAPGLATPKHMFRLNRVRIERSDGVGGLAAKLGAVGA